MDVARRVQRMVVEQVSVRPTSRGGVNSLVVAFTPDDVGPNPAAVAPNV